MLDLLQITNDTDLARRCDRIDGVRLWVDLERMGKAERQAGRNTFISAHEMDDVARIKDVLQRSPLMVRVNPLHEGTADEVEQVIARGADLLMLPMFSGAGQLAVFSRLVGGRKPIVALLETSSALSSVAAWSSTPGLAEIYVGLNDLHLSLGCRFMFEPLSRGLVDGVAAQAWSAGKRFGFGGIAQLDGGLLPGRDVLAEHVRLGSRAVILSRTFHAGGASGSFEQQVGQLREAEQVLSARTAKQVEADRARVHGEIEAIARRLETAA